MNFRLGQWECSGCDYSVGAAAPKEPQDFGSAADSVRRAKLLAPPPTAPPPGAYGIGGVPPGALYDGRPVAREDPLRSEKIIFIVCNAVALLGGFLFMIVMVANLQTALPPGVGIGMLTITGLFSTVIRVAVNAFILFGDVIWAKWCCLGCQGVGLLAVFAGSFGANPYNLGPEFAQFNTISGILDFLLIGWFASIVYRDIQQRQAV